MRHLMRGVFIVGLVGCALLLAAVTRAQLLNAGHLSVSVRQAETVFDNGGNPWAFFSQIPSVAYDQGGSGIAYIATPDSGCATNGSSYRTDYINFNADAGQTPAFRIGCFLAGQLYRTTVNISASTPGPYVVNLSVANGGGSAASVAVLIDGNDSQAIRINVPTTGSYSTFTTAQSGQFNATAGNHVIAISCLTGDSTNHACGDMRWFQGANPPAATTPEPARLAGFTTLAIDQNFDTSSFDQNLNNWFKCPYGNGGVTYNAANPIWYQGWVGFGRGTPCDHTTIGQDPVFGNTALQLYWDNNSFNVVDGGAPNTMMETAETDFSVGRVFTNYYYEIVVRANNNELNGNTTYWSVGNFGASPLTAGSTVIEVDNVERYGTGVGHNLHNFTGGCGSGDCSGGIAATTNSFTSYHRWAARITASLGGSRTVCWYFEDNPYVSGLTDLGCTTQTTTSNQNNGIDVSDAIIMTSGPSQNWTGCPNVRGSGSYPDFCNLSGSNIINYIKTIRVYVCPQWNANQNPAGGAQQCSTSSPNP